MLQGFFKGTEYAGVFIHTHETGLKKISASANIISLGCLGGCMAALVCWIVTTSNTPSWLWRVPFVIGGLLAVVIFFHRMRIQETDDYVEILNLHQVSKTPIKQVFRKHKMEMFVSGALCATYTTFAYSSMMFGNRLFQQAGYPISQSMLFSMFDLLWISISMFLFGKLAERIGMLRQIKFGSAVLIVAAFPLCTLISGELNLVNIYAYMVIVTFLSASIASCCAAYILNLFPVPCRYSGFSITDSLGSIVGGFTPFMMLLFSDLFHSNLGCTIWLYITTVPTFLLICIMEKIIRKRQAVGEMMEIALR
jgi:MFS family permease